MDKGNNTMINYLICGIAIAIGLFGICLLIQLASLL